MPLPTEDGSPVAESPYASPQTVSHADSSASEQGLVDDRRRAWAWVPSLYFAEGLPYVVVMSVAVVMYKGLGIDNDSIAFYTSLLYLPWVIKPLWSPLVDVLGTQRLWIVTTQLAIACGFFGVAAALGAASFFTMTLGFLWLLAISSATHDIAADGFYMAGLDKKSQAWFIGIRSSFYRLAMIAGQGGLVLLAGTLESRMAPHGAWQATLIAAGLFFAALCVYHQFVLPRPASNRPPGAMSGRRLYKELGEAVTSFFAKPRIGVAIMFLLLYRFAEAQLAKTAAPFLMDPADAGGLGLSTSAVGAIYGTVGVAMLTLGGILGGILASRDGVRRWLLPMAAAINLPNAVYVILAFLKPTSTIVIGGFVAIEQFGYGFGFAAYLLVMLEISRGKHQTAHYALCTGLMALGMMLPGMFCGKLQLMMGYQWFFVWVLVATIPSFLATVLVRQNIKE